MRACSMPIMMAQNGLSQVIGSVSGRVAITPSTSVADPVAVLLDLGHGRPVVMGLVQVVPGHLVDPDGEHRFEAGIDPLGR